MEPLQFGTNIPTGAQLLHTYNRSTSKIYAYFHDPIVRARNLIESDPVVDGSAPEDGDGDENDDDDNADDGQDIEFVPEYRLLSGLSDENNQNPVLPFQQTHSTPMEERNRQYAAIEDDLPMEDAGTILNSLVCSLQWLSRR